MKRIFIAVGGLLAAAAVTLAVYYQLTKPTNDGPWRPEYERLASTQIEKDLVTIENLRRAHYDSDDNQRRIDWTKRSVSLTDLKDVWFGISVFSSPGIAHTFLSFDFGDGDPIAISVEARQRPDQRYNPLAGALRRYHLIYVVADERDIIGVRTHGRQEEVFFQPLTISKERAQTLFRDMIERANSLTRSPEFYNTFTTNCTNSILRDTSLPGWRRLLDWRLLLPGFSDRIAYEFGILDQRFSHGELREAARLDPADFEADDPAFSEKIRTSFYGRINRTDN